SPALTQKVFANMRRVGKGCSGVKTPLFEGILVARELEEQGDEEEQGTDDNAAEEPDTAVSEDDVENQSIPSPTPPTPPPQQPQDIPSTSQEQSPPPQPQSPTPAQPHGGSKSIDYKAKDKGEEAKEGQQDDTNIEDVSNQGSMIDELDRDEGAVSMSEKEEKKAKKVKDITGDAQAKGSETISVAAIVPSITAAPVKFVVPSTRQRRGVVIRDPEEESSTKTPTETKSKDKGKGIMDIDWEVEIDHVKQQAKKNRYVQRYQVMKKRPQTEVQARRNMMMYLKNTAGSRLDNFKGMSYDNIRSIFEDKFNSNIEFLLKSKEQIEEEENRVIKSINETPAQKSAKRRRLNKEAKDVEELKQHLEIVPDEDDDVYTEATPLVRKVLVVDYQIIQLNNKPHFKFIRADGTHQLYVSFITMLKNFDREDLESLWSIVKERFSTSKPRKLDGQDQVWMSQRSVHGQAKVKSWKLLESCGVHIVALITTQLIMLVVRRYLLSRGGDKESQTVLGLSLEGK
nr:hypothetical protein [Tanacetum cinerariifolium]